jgi:hypothetical protein
MVVPRRTPWELMSSTTMTVTGGVALVLVTLLQSRTACALDNGVGLTPAMGYNTWDDFRCGGINASNIEKVTHPFTHSLVLSSHQSTPQSASPLHVMSSLALSIVGLHNAPRPLAPYAIRHLQTHTQPACPVASRLPLRQGSHCATMFLLDSFSLGGGSWCMVWPWTAVMVVVVELGLRCGSGMVKKLGGEVVPDLCTYVDNLSIDGEILGGSENGRAQTRQFWVSVPLC